jgi:nitrogen fixation-related uncharacterized protein
VALTCPLEVKMKAVFYLVVVALLIGAVFAPVLRPAFLLVSFSFVGMLLGRLSTWVGCMAWGSVGSIPPSELRNIRDAAPLMAVTAGAMAGLGWGDAALGVYIVAVALVALLWSVALDRLERVGANDADV